jgi:hypothetical protein
MKKNQNMPVWLSKMLSPSIFAQFAEASKRHSKAVYLREKSNKYDLTAPPSF